MAVVSINISPNHDSLADDQTIYWNSATGRYYSDDACNSPISSVNIHTRECYSFTGIFSSSSGGTMYVDEKGNFTDAFLCRSWSQESELYCQWSHSSWLITIDVGEGVGGVQKLYKSVANGVICKNDDLSTAVDKVALPVYSGYTCRFIGANADTAIIDQNGYITDYFKQLELTADKTYSALYLANYTIAFNVKGGFGGSVDLVYDRVHECYQSDAVSIPSRAGYVFQGYFTAATGGSLIIDADGHIADYTPSGNVTAYAQWSRYAIKFNINQGSGKNGTASFFFNLNDDKLYKDANCTLEVDSIVFPDYKYFKCSGLYSATSTSGVLYVDEDGNLTSAFYTAARSATADITIYAKFVRLCYLITISGDGTHPAGKYLYGRVSGGVYSDYGCTDEVTSLEIPYKELYAFNGMRKSASDTADLYINPDGTLTNAFKTMAFTANVTIYTRWTLVALKITISANSGIFTPRAALYYHKANGGVYDYWTCVGAKATSIAMPRRVGYAFLGARESNNDTSTLMIDQNGTLTTNLKNISMTSAKTIYARWKACVKVSLGGGVNIYFDSTYNRWFDATGVLIDRVDFAQKEGYTALGYFTSSTGGTKCINPDGTFVSSFAPSANTTIYPRYEGGRYTLSLDANGGTSATSSLNVVYGQKIGALPTPTKVGNIFRAWKINSNVITANTVWSYARDMVATARYLREIGGVTDWFGFASDAIIPISSSSGDNVKRLCVSHVGSFEHGVSATSGVWRNPSVTYRVIGDTQLNLMLGKAYSSDDGNVSGYFITSVDVSTQVGEFPTITISANANEGADAINLFDVSLNINGSAHAQNLMGCISGGGALQSLSFRASCDPVVCAEDMMPCASDVVRGVIKVNATTIASNGESAPIATNGFNSVGAIMSESDSAFPEWTINLEKEM